MACSNGVQIGFTSEFSFLKWKLLRRKKMRSVFTIWIWAFQAYMYLQCFYWNNSMLCLHAAYVFLTKYVRNF